LAIALKEKAAAHSYMSKEGLLYTDICKSIENEYRKLKDDASEWTPAKHAAQDSKAPPAQFAANAAQATTLMGIQIMALMQSGFASGAKPGTCNHCKKPGHWKRECPELKNQQASGNTRGTNCGNSRGSNQQAPARKGWRSTPRAPGDPAVKYSPGNPKPLAFRWCAKCKRWTMTHDTDSHMGGKDKYGSGPSAQENMFLVTDPSA
jgi:hypothetical protein